MCGSKPKYQAPPPLPPPPQPMRAAQRPHGNEDERGAARRRLYAGILTSPRGVLQSANLGVPLLGGGAAPSTGG